MVQDNQKKSSLRQAALAANIGTQALWAGEEQKLGPGTEIPIVQSIAFGYDNLDEWLAVACGHQPGHIYSRNTNPTVAFFEDKSVSWKEPKPAPASLPAWPPLAIPCSACCGPDSVSSRSRTPAL